MNVFRGFLILEKLMDPVNYFANLINKAIYEIRTH